MKLISILKLSSVVLDFICLLANGYTLLYICITFKLRINVFTLAFIDAFLMTSGCLVSTTIQGLVVGSAILPDQLR